MREAFCIGLDYLGVSLDKAKNNTVRGEEAIISTPDSKVTVCVIPTDEELMIAKDAMALVCALIMPNMLFSYQYENYP